MQSRTTDSLVVCLLVTAAACAHQAEPEDPELNEGTQQGGSAKGGTTAKAGMSSSSGTNAAAAGKAGSGATLPPAGSSGGKAGSKATGGSGGTAGTTSDGGTAGGGGSGTVHMPVEGLSVQFKTQNPSPDAVDFVGGELYVVNVSAQPFSLAELRVRYYLTNEITAVTPSFTWQWGQFGPDNNLGNVTCSGEVVPMPQPKPLAGADSYVEFNCAGGGELIAGSRLVMSWKIGAQGSGNQFVQGDDYSFTTAATDQEKIVVLNGNTVVWGIEP